MPTQRTGSNGPVPKTDKKLQQGALTMKEAFTIALIDQDLRRRAFISHALADAGMHVEPFEDMAELAIYQPRSGVVLVHDDGEAVAALVALMSKAGSWLPVVAFSEGPDPSRIAGCVLEGAVDYLAWPFDADMLSDAVKRSKMRASRMGNARLREAIARSRVERLTRREREVLAGVASGLSNRMIGEKLVISPRTVEIHRANMLNKMGANHTSDAIRIAIEAELVC